MNNSWKKYIHDLLISSRQFKLLEEQLVNSTLIRRYRYAIPSNSSSEITVGLLDKDKLMYLHYTSDCTHGYNNLHDYYFFSNDFDDSITSDDVGLDYTTINCLTIKEMISNGVVGQEIQWIKNGEVLKSTVWVNNIKFRESLDFTNRSTWKRLFGPKIENMTGITKNVINLAQCFPPIRIKK